MGNHLLLPDAHQIIVQDKINHYGYIGSQLNYRKPQRTENKRQHGEQQCCRRSAANNGKAAYQ